MLKKYIQEIHLLFNYDSIRNGQNKNARAREKKQAYMGKNDGKKTQLNKNKAAQ